MKKRDSTDYLIDISDAIDNIAEFVGDMSFEQFVKDKKTMHAVVRNIEIIGEASKKNLHAKTQKRNHRRNRLQPPTTNLLRQKQNLERQHTPTPTRNQRNKPRSNPPKIPQHRTRRKTRQPNPPTSRNSKHRNRRRHGKIQPLLRKSRHATHSRKQTQPTHNRNAATPKQHGLQPHING